MIQISPRYRKILAHRAGPSIGAVAIAFGAVAATASAASAEQTCKVAPGYVNCFSITPMENNDYAVHLGIDVHMSRQDAQNIIDAPGEEFSAKVFGDDWNWDNALFNVPVTWSAAGDSGLSAEFDIVVDGSTLDEDWEGTDELYGRITLFDPRGGEDRTFTTNVLTGDF